MAHDKFSGVTPKQKNVLEFINQHREEKGYSPSQREIADHFGFRSLGTVQNYLVRLERVGVLKKPLNAKRGLETIPPNDDSLSHSSHLLPLLGKVAAGHPIEALEFNESIEVPPDMTQKQGQYFALRIEGDSMIEDGILDGDLVIIKKQSMATNGSTVVAMINNEATIKRYYEKQNTVELHPANSNYEPFVFHRSEHPDFRIEGVLAGVLRYYK